MSESARAQQGFVRLSAAVACGVLALTSVGCGSSGDGGGAPSSEQPATVTSSAQTSTVASSASSTPAPSATSETLGSGEAAYPRYSAGPNTSDGFARNVYQQFLKQWAAGQGSDVTVDALSPSVGRVISMRCSGEQVVHCVGGDNAHVYIYSADAPETETPPADPAGSGDGKITLSGTIRQMSLAEFKASYQPSYANEVHEGENVLFLQLDSPQALTLRSGGGPGLFTREVRELALFHGYGEPTGPYANRSGERADIAIDPSKCRWPSDTRPPLGAPACQLS